MEQPTHIHFSEKQFNLLMGKMCEMQKQLDDFADMKNLFQQFLASSIGIKEVTKSTILDILNDGGRSEKLSPVDPEQDEIAQIRKRNAIKNIQKATKSYSKSLL